MPSDAFSRAFKTAWFSKDAKRAKINDAELCLAIKQVLLGQVDDLGGGVFKKIGSIPIYTDPSSWLKAAGTGFMRIFLPRRTAQTLRKMNYLLFASWPQVMRA
jgi:hypothetical protein